ncbi:MAG: hypothetical protein HYW02_04240, partial [Deltaproteobacteria bacterium]|nr:hypothetical protein [Deltaproteobacteria bacterium]
MQIPWSRYAIRSALALLPGVAACATAGTTGGVTPGGRPKAVPAPKEMPLPERQAYDLSLELLTQSVTVENGPSLSLGDFERVNFNRTGICKPDGKNSNQCVWQPPFWLALRTFIAEKPSTAPVCVDFDFVEKFLRPATESGQIDAALYEVVRERAITLCSTGRTSGPTLPTSAADDIPLTDPAVFFAGASSVVSTPEPPTQTPPPGTGTPQNLPRPAPPAPPPSSPGPKAPAPSGLMDQKTVESLFGKELLARLKQGGSGYSYHLTAQEKLAPNTLPRQTAWAIIPAEPKAVARRLLSMKGAWAPGMTFSDCTKTADELVREAKQAGGATATQYFELKLEEGGMTILSQAKVFFDYIKDNGDGSWEMHFQLTPM